MNLLASRGILPRRMETLRFRIAQYRKSPRKFNLFTIELPEQTEHDKWCLVKSETLLSANPLSMGLGYC